MKYTKHELRKTLIEARNNFIGKASADSAIFNKLLDICGTSSKIFTYLSYGNEVDTLALVKHLLNEKKAVYVPMCNIEDSTMKFSRIYSTRNLYKNHYGILEPMETIDSEAVADMIIFPGAAFDIKGNRIGYGKGYYDRFMSMISYSPIKVGVCYDFQLLDTIPAEKHDVKMDVIITENRAITV